jgi:transketolase
MRIESLRDAFGEELAAMADTNAQIVVLDGDLANSTRADIFAERHPTRFIECGIAEQNMVGVAAGLATLGFRPWVSTFAAFLARRALDQVDVSIAQPKLPVVLVGGYAGVLNGRNGRTHHSLVDYGIMRSLPAMTVIAPCDAQETRLAMRELAALDGPAYLRLARDPSPVVSTQSSFRIGDPVVLTDSAQRPDVVLVSTGVQSSRVAAAASTLERAGVRVRVVHLPTIAPLKTAMVLPLLDADLVFVVEDHSPIGGIGALILELISQSPSISFKRIDVGTYTQAAPNDDLLNIFSLSSAAVATAVRTALSSANA